VGVRHSWVSAGWLTLNGCQYALGSPRSFRSPSYSLFPAIITVRRVIAGRNVPNGRPAPTAAVSDARRLGSLCVLQHAVGHEGRQHTSLQLRAAPPRRPWRASVDEQFAEAMGLSQGAQLTEPHGFSKLYMRLFGRTTGHGPRHTLPRALGDEELQRCSEHDNSSDGRHGDRRDGQVHDLVLVLLRGLSGVEA
jgi:hypothetical protein